MIVKTRIVQIGNSKGIRVPKVLLNTRDYRTKWSFRPRTAGATAEVLETLRELFAD